MKKTRQFEVVALEIALQRAVPIEGAVPDEALPELKSKRAQQKNTTQRARERVQVLNRKIFVVDDETIIADSLAAILNMRGYEATAYYDGLAALSACERSTPQCLISDVMMLEMDGVELAMKVRARYPECRIFLSSGYASAVDILESARASGHVFEVLQKPVHPRELLARLEAPSRRNFEHHRSSQRPTI